MLQAFVITPPGRAQRSHRGHQPRLPAQDRRQALVLAIHWGIATSIALSIMPVSVAKARNQPLWEGVLGIVAAFLGGVVDRPHVAAGRHEAGHEGKLAACRSRPARPPSGAFVFTLLMITREGMETAMLMNALLFQVKAINIAAGPSAECCRRLYRVSLVTLRPSRKPLPVLPVTAIFLLVFNAAAHLRLPRACRSARAAQQRDAARGDGGMAGRVYGQWLTHLLVILPLGWLAVSSPSARTSA